MVAIAASKVAQFLRRPNLRLSGFLLYGSDAGQISERAAALSTALSESQNPPGEVVVLTEEDLLNDPERLAVETRTVPMFGGNKIVRVKATGRAVPLVADMFSGEPPPAATVVVESGNLRKDAKLRRLFEGGAQLAALPCYGDEGRDIKVLIREELAREGLGIQPDAERNLVDLLGADHALSRAEIRKLATYGHGKSEITVEDVHAVVGDTSALLIDTAIDAIMQGRAEQALYELDRLNASGLAPGTYLLSLLRHLKRVHFVNARMQAGDSLDAAVRKMKPPVHFRREQTFKSQCKTWDITRLNRAVATITGAIRQLRLAPEMDQQIAAETVMRLFLRADRCAG